MDHQVDLERFSITDRINELSDVLRVRHRVRFEELFAEHRTRSALVITFLALLEMTRLRLTRLLQQGPLEPIEVELSVTDEIQPLDAAQSTGSDGSELNDAGTGPRGGDEGATEAAAVARNRPDPNMRGTAAVEQPTGLGSHDQEADTAGPRQVGQRSTGDAGEDTEDDVEVPEREQE